MHAKLWRITSFRLTVLYAGFFALAVAGLVALVYAKTANYQDQQVDQLLVNEGRIFSGMPVEESAQEMVHEMRWDVRHINFYGLFDARGKALGGNLTHPPQGLSLDGKPQSVAMDRNADLFPAQQGVRALGLPLQHGGVLVIARDMALLEQLRVALLRGCFLIGAVILVVGTLGGIFYSLPAVRHIREVDQTARSIAAGDYTRRLPLGKRNLDLDALAGSVNAMLDETERLMGEVKSCSDNIAHDLRTPLTRLRASIYRGQQQAEEDSKLRPMLDHALTQIDLLLTRFRALSRISEIESKQRRAGFAQMPLKPVLQQIAELYEPLASQSGVRLTLRTEPAPEIECDGELLFEAIGNLVDNAIKFSPAGGEVAVRLDASDDGPIISVSDSGPGIPADQRKSVLQRFYRVAEARNVPGSGLGLSLVDAIARLHHFALVLDETAGGGVCARLHCWPHTGSHG